MSNFQCDRDEGTRQAWTYAWSLGVTERVSYNKNTSEKNTRTFSMPVAA